MTAAALPDQPDRRRAALVGVIAAMAAVNVIYVASMPLMSLVLDRQGVDASLIGLNTAAQGAAVFAAAPFLPGLIRRFGPGRVMQVALLMAAAMLALIGLLPNVWLWFPLRFLMGAAATALWIASEAWINALVTDAVRGRVVALYSAAGAAGGGLAPLVLIVLGTEGTTPFLAVAAICALGVLPLLAGGSGTGALDGQAKVRPHRFLVVAPLPFAAVLLYAAGGESLVTFFPSYGIAQGLGEAAALAMLTAFKLGGLVLQVPIGWLADRVGPRPILSMVAAGSFLGFVALPFLLQPYALGLAFAALLGGTYSTVYSLTLLLLGRTFSGADLSSASALFQVFWSSGALLGPMLAGVAITGLGQPGLIATELVLFGTLTALVLLLRR
ncbi:MFS transporter [Zavarzinia sp. CC-PAN008]|uniref:MFS transporter n=1 Tax=Zavarzinia sp. CC-PAN008 TaxID=3243332 RepID=UPI003F749043